MEAWQPTTASVAASATTAHQRVPNEKDRLAVALQCVYPSGLYSQLR
jgi:hypothetical protein